MTQKWIQGAIKHPGAEHAAAKRAGQLNPDGTIKKSWLREQAAKELGTAAKRARLALTLEGMHK